MLPWCIDHPLPPDGTVQSLICPVCRDPFVRIIAVEPDAVLPPQIPVRREVRLFFEGACRHRWCLHFGDFGGQTLMSVVTEE